MWWCCFHIIKSIFWGCAVCARDCFPTVVVRSGVPIIMSRSWSCFAVVIRRLVVGLPMHSFMFPCNWVAVMIGIQTIIEIRHWAVVIFVYQSGSNTHWWTIHHGMPVLWCRVGLTSIICVRLWRLNHQPMTCCLISWFKRIFIQDSQQAYSFTLVSINKWPVFPVGSVLSQMVLGLISWNIEIELLNFFLSLN